MNKSAFAYAKTKTQISFAVTAKLISGFVFATRIARSLFLLNPNFMPLDIFCNCTVQFVSDLIGNPEDRFSYDEAHIKVRSFKSKENILPLIQEEQLSVNGERMCAKYWLPASERLAQE